MYSRLQNRLVRFTGIARGGASERHARARLTAIASIATRATSILTLAVLVPTALAVLGPERFGLWMLLSSLTMVLTFADLGIGNGIVNEIAAAHGRDDAQRAVRVATSGMFLLVIIAILAGVVFAITFAFVPWARAFNVHSAEAQAEVPVAVVAFMACFLVNLPLTIVTKIQLGSQEGFLANAVAAFSNIASFCGVYAGLKLHAGVPLLVVLLVGLPAMVGGLYAVWFFRYHRPELRLRADAIDKSTLRRLGRAGMAFFVMQLSFAVSTRFDAFFIARASGVEQAGLFLSVERLFAFASVLPLAFVYPLWPAYREALHRNDVNWVRRTFQRSIMLSFALTATFCLPILLFGDQIFSRWLGTQTAIPPTLLGGFAVWKLVEIIGTGGAMLMNGAGRLRAGTIMLALMAGSSLVAKFFLIQYLGAYSVVWITASAWTLFCILPLLYFVPAIFRGTGDWHPIKTGDA